jgi:hypothetical protein
MSIHNPYPNRIPKKFQLRGDEGVSEWLKATVIALTLTNKQTDLWTHKDMQFWLHKLLVTNSPITEVALSLGWEPCINYLRDISRFKLQHTPAGYVYAFSPYHDPEPDPEPINPYATIPYTDLVPKLSRNSVTPFDQQRIILQAVQDQINQLPVQLQEAALKHTMSALQHHWPNNPDVTTYRAYRLKRDLSGRRTLRYKGDVVLALCPNPTHLEDSQATQFVFLHNCNLFGYFTRTCKPKAYIQPISDL